MKKLFSYVDYEKISDDLYYLGGDSRLILRMNVSLGKQSKDKTTRHHFYNEYEYDSKYNDVGRLVSIRRSYDYYMTLESLEERMSGIMIRPQDMILLRSRLAEVVQWFSSDVFIMRKNMLMVNKRPKTVRIDGFPEGKSISFDPVVITWEDNSQSMGVRITLSDNIFSDIVVDKIFAFVYIINSINLVQSAQMMLAFLGMPEYGTNRYQIDTSYNNAKYADDTEKEPETVIKERTVQASRKKSYFDSIGGQK